MRLRSPLLVLLLFACGKTPEPTPPPPASWTLEDLTAAQGFSIRIPEYPVPNGEESQRCYFIQMPDLNSGQPYYIDRFNIALNTGSHHMNIFRVKTIVGLKPTDGVDVMLGNLPAKLVDGANDSQHAPCWKSANWADWPLVANSQNSKPNDPYTDWKLPDGVAVRFDPGEMLMLQPHYVNAMRQETPSTAHIGINMYRFQGMGDPVEMGSLFATQQSIRICESFPTPKFSGTCRFPTGQNITIAAANGHFHSRGTKFSMFSWDGQTVDTPGPEAKFYESDAWNDPPMMRGLSVHPPAGGGVWWSCEYQWRPPTEFSCADVNAKDPQMQNDCCYTFGGNTDVGEHCNVFVYYYPRLQERDVFCN